ncbi:hypothetical protein A2230_08115 [candidate division WOR-1 bacterium RIFOXYA2_FULL_36_21]|uniref:Glycosyltransferase RgtA/B/C/D-like domain-containing protein n=1 Tax=candidate division WOR-1 bacterium RIFOXYB2_FULL_36_35 TaxID=1802578 RepID=A0A1F4S3V4_UNCSA|nr:MAG: hypothetical protein A2230_08115 [candidate division WOR-1 bacterium RIFOXYA2_FULL_36_21]OGC14792.1 MAG: hypothetical protein A2282_06440 [candidate division WOR-1 bacterium RIFOXYA12_FULL_36_13]OGC15116.1 MAG: hypothetical protein A2290_02810 [candidate division WOR-1 bacterium RIFOXYB2_FULL_36_35]
MTKKVILLFLCIFIIGLFVRLYNLQFRSLWGDEAHSLYISYNFYEHNFRHEKISFIETFREIYQAATINLTQDSHLPVYFVLLSFWIKLFGPSEYILRLLSVIIGLSSIPLLFVFTKKYFDSKVALAASFLLSISPLLVMHSHEIRMYGLLMLFGLLSTWCFWEILNNGEKVWHKIGYLVFSLLFLLTHVYSLLLMASHFIFWCYYCFFNKKIKEYIILPLLLFVAVLLASPFYIKMFMLNFSNVISSQAEMAFSVFPWYTKIILFPFVLSFGETLAPWSFFVVMPVGLAWAFLLLKNFKKANNIKIAFLLILVLFPIISSAILLKPTMPKYLIASFPFYLILVSYSLTNLKTKPLKYLLILLIVFGSLISIKNYFSLEEYHNSNQIEEWKTVSSIIMKNKQAGDIVLTTSHYINFRIINYYLNIIALSGLKIYTLHQDLNKPVTLINNSYCMFDYKKRVYPINNITAKRIWFVEHIADDKVFPEGYINNLKQRISSKYKEIYQQDFTPYGKTLAAKLPIKRHSIEGARITLTCYSLKI